MRRMDVRTDSEEEEDCQECIKFPTPEFVMRSLRGWLVEPWIVPVPMNPMVWSRLPEELLARCVAMLPVDSRLRFLLVAKRWRSILRSAEFEALCSDLGPVSSAPICSLEYHPGQSALCGYATDVASLSSSFSEVHRLKFSKGFPEKWRQIPKGCWILQEGLVCIFKPGQQEAIDLCVLNPLTQQWLELPPHFVAGEYDHWVHARAQVKVLGQNTGQFELIVVNRTAKLSIFSSKEGSWSRVNLERRAAKDLWPINLCAQALRRRLHHWPQHILCNGLLFLAERVPEIVAVWWIRIRVYNLTDGTLVRQLDRDFYPAVGARKILEHGGRLFLLHGGNELNYGVWELDLATFLWTEVSALSEYLRLLLMKPALPREPMTEIGTWYQLRDGVFVGHNLCLTVDDYEDMQKHHGSRGLTHIVAYNVVEDSWSIVSRRMLRRKDSSSYYLFTPFLKKF